MGVPHPGRTQLGPQVHSPHSAPRQPCPGAGGSLWPPTFPTVGFSLRAPPTPVLLSPACPARLPGWPGLPPPPALGTHTAWPGGPGSLEHPISHPVWPLLCSLPNLLLMALCPLTPPVPAHSVFTEVPLPPPCLVCLSAPACSRHPAGQEPWDRRALSAWLQLPRHGLRTAPWVMGSGQPSQPRARAFLGRPGSRPPQRLRVARVPTAPPVHRPLRVLVLNPHLQGVSPHHQPALSCSKPQEMPPGAASHPAVSDTQEPRGALLRLPWGRGASPRCLACWPRSPAAPTSAGLQVRAGLASASALWAPALTACPGAGPFRPHTHPCRLAQAPGAGLALNARPPAPTTAPPPGHPALPGRGPPTPRCGALGGLEAVPPHACCGFRAWLLPVPSGQLGRQWPRSLPSGRPSGPPGPGFLRRESRACG